MALLTRSRPEAWLVMQMIGGKSVTTPVGQAIFRWNSSRLRAAPAPAWTVTREETRRMQSESAKNVSAFRPPWPQWRNEPSLEFADHARKEERPGRESGLWAQASFPPKRASRPRRPLLWGSNTLDGANCTLRDHQDMDRKDMDRKTWIARHGDRQDLGIAGCFGVSCDLGDLASLPSPAEVSARRVSAAVARSAPARRPSGEARALPVPHSGQRSWCRSGWRCPCRCSG